MQTKTPKKIQVQYQLFSNKKSIQRSQIVQFPKSKKKDDKSKFIYAPITLLVKHNKQTQTQMSESKNQLNREKIQSVQQLNKTCRKQLKINQNLLNEIQQKKQMITKSKEISCKLQEFKNKFEIIRSNIISQISINKRDLQKTTSIFLQISNQAKENNFQLKTSAELYSQNQQVNIKNQAILQHMLQEKSQEIQDMKILSRNLIQEAKLLERDLQLMENEQKKNANNLEINKFQIMIIRFQLLNHFRTGFNVQFNQVLQEEAFDYTAWKLQKTKKVELEEINYFIISQLYPNIRDLFSKLSYQSQQYEILLKGIIEPKLMEDLKNRLANPQFFESSKFKKESKKEQLNIKTSVYKRQKLVIAFGWIVSNIYEEFKHKLLQQFGKFDNTIIKITQMKIIRNLKYTFLEQLKIHYLYKNCLVVKTVYLLNFPKNLKIDIFQSIYDKRKKSQISEMLDECINGERVGYLLIQIPLLAKPTETKLYLQLYDFFKKDK